MKIVLILLTTITFFTGCVDKNGFDNFGFSLQKQQWENNFISSKIEDKNSFQGTISAVYLNKVLPEKYNKNEWFYLSIYLKDTTQKLTFTLNDQPSIVVKEIPNNDEFKEFVQTKKKWTKYYIVEFAEQKENDVLSFIAKNSTLASNKMIFKKNE
jgi:hypothetical protein